MIKRKLGSSDLQSMIDSKVRGDINIYKREDRLPEEFNVRDGLLVADDLNNCSLKEN